MRNNYKAENCVEFDFFVPKIKLFSNSSRLSSEILNLE